MSDAEKLEEIVAMAEALGHAYARIAARARALQLIHGSREFDIELAALHAQFLEMKKS